MSATQNEILALYTISAANFELDKIASLWCPNIAQIRNGSNTGSKFDIEFYYYKCTFFSVDVFY